MADESFVQQIPTYIYPWLSGFGWAVSIYSLSVYSITFVNPAIDLGLRIWGLIPGEGGLTFSGTDGYFWIPLVLPFAGTVVAWVVHKFLLVRFLK